MPHAISSKETAPVPTTDHSKAHTPLQDVPVTAEAHTSATQNDAIATACCHSSRAQRAPLLADGRLDDGVVHERSSGSALALQQRLEVIDAGATLLLRALCQGERVLNRQSGSRRFTSCSNAPTLQCVWLHRGCRSYGHGDLVATAGGAHPSNRTASCLATQRICYMRIQTTWQARTYWQNEERQRCTCAPWQQPWPSQGLPQQCGP